MKKHVWALLCLSAGLCKAGFAVEHSMVFPRFEKSARSAAMGESGSVVSGVDALGVNPAGLLSKKTQLLTQFHSLALGDTVGSAVFLLPRPEKNFAMAASYMALDSSGFESSDGSGLSQGSFSHVDQMMGLHMAKGFWAGKTLYSLGLGVKGLSTRVGSYKGTGWAVDAGARLKRERLSLGVAGINLGKGPVLKTEESKWPALLSLSMGYRVWEPLTLTAGASREQVEKRTLGAVGLEHWVGQMLALRGGYVGVLSGPGDSGVGGVAVGLGLTLSGHSLDYSFEPYTGNLQNTSQNGSHRVTLTFRF